jgi:hypothetical protein
VGRVKPEGNPTVDADFKINLFGISGLKVDALQLTGESYKPFKARPQPHAERENGTGTHRRAGTEPRLLARRQIPDARVWAWTWVGVQGVRAITKAGKYQIRS